MIKFLFKILIISMVIAACGKNPPNAPRREVSNPLTDGPPSAGTPIDRPSIETERSISDVPGSDVQSDPIDPAMADTNPSVINGFSSSEKVDLSGGDGGVTKSERDTSAWAYSNQTQINVGVIGDSISQGTFAETTLGEPFPRRYAQFYDQHIHLLAWIKFAPSLDARTTLGHVMGQVFKDFWLPHSYVGNERWGILPQLQELYPWAEIKIHSQALMASTSYSIESQLNQLLSKNIAYDYFLIAIGSNDVCSSDVISPELYGEKLRMALSKIRSHSAAPILLVQVSPIHKITKVFDEKGQNILDKPIDYSQFHQHLGLSNLVAKFGLMPPNCREHIRIECPRALASPNELEATVAKFNQQLATVAASFDRSHIVRFDPNIEITHQDLAADCFHPNARLQQKFFQSIDLRSLIMQ